MTHSPWASGPSEILQHGLSLLEKDSDKNRRLAMISIDNAVELTIKTFLGLPKRITGITISRKEYQEISESFPMLLDALEKHVTDKLSGLDLGEIEWFHRLRNQLYHQGNGLTVDKDKVEIYANLGKLLFQNLFGIDVQVSSETDENLLGKFLMEWVRLEKAIYQAAMKDKNIIKGAALQLPSNAIMRLLKVGKISQATVEQFDKLREIRNKVVHGVEDYREVITSDTIKTLLSLSEQFNKLEV